MIPAIESLGPFLQALESVGRPYVIGGSLASGAWGQPRQTNDIDIACQLDLADAYAITARLSSDYMIDLISVESTLSSSEEYRSFQVLHLPTMFKFDVFVPLEDAFHASVLIRRERVEISEGVFGYVCSPEDIVIQKLRWFVLGNQVSDRQWNDVVQVLEIQAHRLDVIYMRGWAEHFGLEDLLMQAMGEAGA